MTTRPQAVLAYDEARETLRRALLAGDAGPSPAGDQDSGEP